MDRMLNVMTVFSILLLGLVLASVRRAHIRVEYSVSWLAAALVLLILSRWQGLLNRITAFLGVSDAPLALLMTAGAVFLIVLYRLSLMISHLKDSNIALVQRVAILEFRLECLDEKTKAVSQSQRVGQRRTGSPPPDVVALGCRPGRAGHRFWSLWARIERSVRAR
jgi:hypothetical protein